MAGTKAGRIRLAQALTALMPTLACGAAWGVADVVDRPSMISERASQALFLAVTRAGHRLVAAGERGIVLLSDDDGATWRQASVPVSVTLTSVHFLDERQGWITGHSGVLLHTSDAGQTWSKRFDGTEAARLVLDGVEAKGAGADPALLADARRLVADGPDKPLLDVHFVSPDLGFVVGAYGLFLRTADGGRTWSAWHARLPDLKGRHLTRIARIDGLLYLVGEHGAAYVSSDGGDTFKALKSPYQGTFFGVAPWSAGEVVIYGLRGNVFRVARGGAEWTKVPTPAPVTYCASVYLASGKTVLASQTGGLLQNESPGAALQPVAAPAHGLVAAMAEAADGALIVAGRGMTRLSLDRAAERAR